MVPSVTGLNQVPSGDRLNQVPSGTNFEAPTGPRRGLQIGPPTGPCRGGADGVPSGRLPAQPWPAAAGPQAPRTVGIRFLDGSWTVPGRFRMALKPPNSTTVRYSPGERGL